MSLTYRKLLIVATMSVILLLAGAFTLVSWLDRLGLIAWAQAIRDEYVSGTTISITIVLLILIGTPAGYVLIRRCSVCERVLLRPGRYCPVCGSRL